MISWSVVKTNTAESVGVKYHAHNEGSKTGTQSRTTGSGVMWSPKSDDVPLMVETDANAGNFFPCAQFLSYWISIKYTQKRVE